MDQDRERREGEDAPVTPEPEAEPTKQDPPPTYDPAVPGTPDHYAPDAYTGPPAEEPEQTEVEPTANDDGEEEGTGGAF